MDEFRTLVWSSAFRAIIGPGADVATALAEHGWRELVRADEALALTALFEQQGYLAADTEALDVVAATLLGIAGDAAVIWPVSSHAGQVTSDGSLAIDGVALRGVLDMEEMILVPAAGRLHALAVTSVEGAPLGGMASGSAWQSVQLLGLSTADLGPWSDVERPCRLALASELIGITRRIIDISVEQVTTLRQFGRPVGSGQTVRSRLAEAYAHMAGARAMVAAAWDDGSPESAMWAKATAARAHDVAAKQALRVFGAMGLCAEHPLQGLVRRGFSLDALLGQASRLSVVLGRGLLGEQPVGEANHFMAVGRF